MTILLIVIGNKVVYKNDYVVLTGKIDAKATSKSIEYPTGFNSNNCVVVSYMFNNSLKNSYGIGSVFDTSSYLNGNFASSVTLSDNNIIIKAKLISLSSEQYPIVDDIAVDVNYKIVLMKI